MANALAYEAGFRDKGGRVCSRPITAGAIQGAREQLILRRETHLDQLADKLQEERVRRVIEPLLSGSAQMASVLADDIQYVRDSYRRHEADGGAPVTVGACNAPG